MRTAKFFVHLVGIGFCSSAVSVPCTDAPEDAVQLVFRVLENQGRDQSAVYALYQGEFASEFKKTYSFPQFYSQLREVQKNLRIGVDQNRSWESRGLGGDAIVEPIGDSPPAFHVQFLTTSPVGKIGQRAYVICERSEWKLTGIWYFPLSNSVHSGAVKGVPRYCCTAAGKLGPYPNPDARSGRLANEGEACYGTTNLGQAVKGTACY